MQLQLRQPLRYGHDLVPSLLHGCSCLGVEEAVRRFENGPIRPRQLGRLSEPLGAACGFEGPASVDAAPSLPVAMTVAMPRSQDWEVGCRMREDCQAIVAGLQRPVPLEEVPRQVAA